MVNEEAKGAAFALCAYVIWGLLPLYFSLIDFLSPGEILSLRIIWSTVFLFALITYANKWVTLKELLSKRNSLRWLMLSSLLIAANWLTYIWALQNGQVIDTSLGYYIVPMVSVLLGVVFLGERLRPLQLFAVAIGSLGVIHEIMIVGRLPVVALILAVTFGLYGLVRKKVAVDSAVGLFVETLLLLPFALAFLVYLLSQEQNPFLHFAVDEFFLMLGLGLVTALPLLCFGAAALRLSLTTLGFFQYLAPSMVLVLAVTIYDEPFTLERASTFALIAIAVILFSIEAYFNRRSGRISLR